MNTSRPREAWIIDAVRSPRGKGRATGSLHGVHPQRVLAQVLNGLRDRVGLDTQAVGDVIMGCSFEVADHAFDIARNAVLDAGWSTDAPGVTINRYCGSGQQAVNFATMAVLSGHEDLVVAGGVESMSRMGSMQTDGFWAGNQHLFELYPMIPQGLAGDLIATIEGFTRTDCDALAVESQARAAVAIAEGRFANSIVPIHHDDGSLALDCDEHPRAGTSIDDLARLAPSFAPLAEQSPPAGGPSFAALAASRYPDAPALSHVHHAGNSSGVVDGASALLIASSDYARAHGLQPRARIRMTAAVGSEPVIMLTAPAAAAQRCAAKAGLTLDDIDLFEVNEAFAAVVLKFLKDTGVDPASVNVNGGAIALGHPIGATGGMLIGTLLDELERTDRERGLVAMCTGGGMGTASIIERT